MQEIKAFLDTNVILYILSEDNFKADRSEKILQSGNLINVQVLNELVNVSRRKLALSWKEINEITEIISSLCKVNPLTIEVHDKGKFIAERYELSVYDALIVAAALQAKCKILYSEDMQHGQLIENQLRIQNPFL